MITEAAIKERVGAFGSTYFRPVYGRGLFARLQEILADGPSETVVLLPARTDTRWFRLLRAYPRCFIHGRVGLDGQVGSAPFPSAIFYLGSNPNSFAAQFADIGTIWERYQREAA